MQSLFRRRRSNYKIKTADHWNNKLYFKIKLWFFVLKLFPSSRGGFRTHQSGRHPCIWQFPQKPTKFRKIWSAEEYMHWFIYTATTERHCAAALLIHHRWEFIDLAISPTFPSQIFKPRNRAWIWWSRYLEEYTQSKQNGRRRACGDTCPKNGRITAANGGKWSRNVV